MKEALKEVVLYVSTVFVIVMLLAQFLMLGI